MVVDVNNPYKDLGIEGPASDAKIRAAFRRRAKSTHPDHGGDAAAFTLAQAAFAMLSDPVQRAAIDQQLSAARLATRSSTSTSTSTSTSSAPSVRPYSPASEHGAHRSVVHVWEPRGRQRGWQKWYVAASVGTFGAALLTSWARGRGLAPHTGSVSSTHLSFDNLMFGAGWAHLTGTGAVGVVLTIGAGAAYSFVLATAWLWRMRYDSPVRGRELVWYLGVVLGVFTFDTTVRPTAFGVVLSLLGVAVWFRSVSRRSSPLPSGDWVAR